MDPCATVLANERADVWRASGVAPCAILRWCCAGALSNWCRRAPRVLQGENKVSASQKYGEATVQSWRRDYTSKPPALRHDDAAYTALAADGKYASLRVPIPLTESLQEVQHRVLALWKAQVLPAMQCGKTVRCRAPRCVTGPAGDAAVACPCRC